MEQLPRMQGRFPPGTNEHPGDCPCCHDKLFVVKDPVVFARARLEPGRNFRATDQLLLYQCTRCDYRQVVIYPEWNATDGKLPW